MKPVSFKPISFTRQQVEEAIIETMNEYLERNNDKESVAYYARSGFACALQSKLIGWELENKLKGVK